MEAIIRSAHLPVSHEVTVATLAPPRPGCSPPQGRMDLVVTDSNFTTILDDVAITHPNPSINQSVTQAMLRQGLLLTRKHEEYKIWRCCSQDRCKIYTISLETFGSLGKSSNALLHSLSSKLFRHSPNSDMELEIMMKSKLINLWRTRISLTLQKSNARLLL